MRYEWFEIEYEGDLYDVCIDTHNAYEVEEIRAHDSEVNLIPVMDEGVISYMEDRARIELLLRHPTTEHWSKNAMDDAGHKESDF